jgi:NTE family protein
MPKKYALILSGGGARGAYEVGVLKFLFEEFPKIYGFVPKFDIVCGTSVGAIHASFVAANMDSLTQSIPKLINLWSSLKPGDIVDFNFKQLLSLKDIIGNSKKATSICGAKSLRNLLLRECDWENISYCIDNGFLETLCISATSADSGKTNIFAQSSQTTPSRKLFRSQINSTEIGIEHALASASIPIVFPPVKIDGEWFTDGGVRQNTPIEPALAFGATHVFTVGMWHDGAAQTPLNGNPPSAGHLIGKIFNSFFIDHAQADFHNLEKINTIIESIADNLGVSSESLMRNEFKVIKNCILNPSKDIGSIAANYLNSPSSLKRDLIYKKIMKAIDLGNSEADLASYLLFDGEFSRILIELGFEDAKNNLHHLEEFFGISDDL